MSPLKISLFFSLITIIWIKQGIGKSGTPPILTAQSFSINYADKVTVPKEKDIVIVSPYAEIQGKKDQAHAYISLTELSRNSPLFEHLPKEAVVSENTAWSSCLVQIDHPEWHVIIKKELDFILKQGYRNIFIDTVDGVETLCQKVPKKCQIYQRNAVMLIRLIRERMSGTLIANRGFSIYQDIDTFVQGVLIESFFYGKNENRYETRTEEEMKWLKMWVERLRSDGKLVLAVDYAENLSSDQKADLHKKAGQLDMLWRLDHESLQY
ncbi:MAG: hypothetical protein D3924_00410 [Candidatus Electrothrix sp. AR4]|nr:hypothetical protein [Candidatus Electrothrix sp. AR4]